MPSSFPANPVRATQCNVLGYTQLTLAGVVGLGTIPANARRAEMVSEVQATRWRADGTDPTTAVGQLIPVGTVYNYLGDLTKMRVIQASAGAILNITFFDQ